MKHKGPSRYPNFFPGQVKYLPDDDAHYFLCALSCVQYAIEKIPKARMMINTLIIQFSTKRFQKLFNRIDKLSPQIARFFVKYIDLYMFQDKKWARIIMVPCLIFLLPFFLSNLAFFKYLKLIFRFVREAFNKDPKHPIVLGSPWLFFAISTVARFTYADINPIEYDREHHPLAADIALTRPKTVQGRKMKPRYNAFMKKYTKVTDKYYKSGARKWLYARVLCGSVAEAERQLSMGQNRLNQFLYDEPWDSVMGYRKR